MKPIKRKSLAEEVAEHLRHNIERGVYKLNDKLPTEPELMTTFEVGRSTIREAIKYLTQQGFVSVQQGLGTFVISHVSNRDLDAKIERADFADIHEVRQLLELKIVEKAAHNRKDEHLKEMAKSLQERKHYAHLGNIEESIHADIRFHTMLAESSGNTILFALYKTLSDHIAKFFNHIYKDTASFTDSQDLHESLLQAIKAKKSAEALHILKEIIGN
ncbi:FadR/GntR family transcriptional regulator [Sphingobacterium sp. Mn56C]|uniref:FadR/GntR family transcriptional regulator n=1 Tax=Sphingobacterium sp. Mn56C TaxID=3395261 RepID=UPI003BE13FCF